jgi:hypothetical protein
VNTNPRWKAKVAAAAKRYRENPRVLRRLVRKLRHPETRSHCRRAARFLLEHEPNSKDAFISLIYSCATERKRKSLRNYLDLALKSVGDDSAQFQAILEGVRNSLTDQNQDIFKSMVAETDYELQLFLERQNRYKKSNQRLAKRKRVIPHSCDLICVASNEGPYIAEFIHHYLYQGFSDIFVGLNNDSSGLTEPILKAIATQYPQVHLINTDREHQRAQQRGSYCKLYQEATKSSHASHCMVADVDEFWVAYPFSTKIQGFLKAHEESHVVSSNWLHCHGGELFGNPLDLANTQLRLTSQFKSLFKYGTAIADLGAHVPWVQERPSITHTNSEGKCIESVNRSFKGVVRLKKKGSLATIGKANIGWMIHRLIRSELEYASKLLYPDVTKIDIPFKENRKGFMTDKEGHESRQLAHNIFGSTCAPPEDYVNSLEIFIQHCDISQALQQARATINEEAILKRIDTIPPKIIHDYRRIWLKTLRGTRFLEILKSKEKQFNAIN